MFPVEILLIDEEKLADTMERMRTWLDHRRFEPAVFRCSFTSTGIRVRVEFPVQGEAAAFARAFDGSLAAAP